MVSPLNKGRFRRLGTTDCELLQVSLNGNLLKRSVFEDGRSDGVSCRLANSVSHFWGYGSTVDRPTELREVRVVGGGEG